MKYISLIAIAVLLGFGVRSQQNPTASFLWKIAGKGLKQESYLLLTSTTCQEKIQLSPKTVQAINESTVVAVENNLFEKTSAQKLRGSMLAVADSQRIRNVFTPAQYQEFVRKYKDEGAPNEAFDQLNAIKVDFLYMMRVSELSPCDLQVRADKIEEVLQRIAEKQNKRFVALQTVEDVLADNALHNKSYWQQNMWFVFKNPEAFRQTLQQKNDLYGKGDFAGLQTLYRETSLYHAQNNDNVLSRHVANLSQLVDRLIQKDPGFIQANIANALLQTHSLLDRLKELGYTLTPVIE